MSIACWIPKATNTHSEYVTLHCHCSNGCTNASQWYVTRTSTLPVCLSTNLTGTQTTWRQMTMTSDCATKGTQFNLRHCARCAKQIPRKTTISSNTAERRLSKRQSSETSNIRTHIFFVLRSNNEKSAITSRNKVLCHFY